MARIRIDGDGSVNRILAPNPFVDTYDIYGFGGNDTLGGGAGGDLLSGGSGFDFATYERADARVVVDMMNMSANSGWARHDQFSSIEGLIGSHYDDWLGGNNGDNIIEGRGGNDTVSARGGDDVVRDAGGNDTFDGGTDNFDPDNLPNPHVPDGDILEYTGNAKLKLGITANLGSGRVIEHGFFVNGYEARDRITGFEGIRGTAFDDTIYGSGRSDAVLAGGVGSDLIYGRGGNDFISGGDDSDTLYGEAGFDLVYGGRGNDTISGGTENDDLRGDAGIDTVSYDYVSEADAEGRGVRVNLEYLTDDDTWIQRATASSGTASNVLGSGSFDEDDLSGFENVIGTQFDDSIQGSSADNELVGGDGDDGLNGYTGNDTLRGGEGEDTLWGDLGTDTLYGDDGDDLLLGGGDGDILIGGAGRDTADYSTRAEAVTASLSNPAINTGTAAGDTYDSIENLSGSSRGDTLWGDNVANVLRGFGGNDTLYGLGGQDTFIGDTGADHFHGGTHEDTVDYSQEYNPDQKNVVIDMVWQDENDGLAAGDTYAYVERFVGTGQDDFFYGNNGLMNRFYGNGGDDLFVGRGGWKDYFYGGEGDDLAEFANAQSAYSFRVLHFNDGEEFLEVTRETGAVDDVTYLIGVERMSFAGQIAQVADFL